MGLWALPSHAQHQLPLKSYPNVLGGQTYIWRQHFSPRNPSEGLRGGFQCAPDWESDFAAVAAALGGVLERPPSILFLLYALSSSE